MAEEKPVEEELTHAILLSERVRSAIDEAGSFKTECNLVGKHVDILVDKLRAQVRSSSSSTAQSFYDRPIRRIVSQVCKNLESALSLIRKCKRRNVFRRVFTIISSADFRKVTFLVEASVGDMKWLSSILDTHTNNPNSSGLIITLPPIASNDPILAWVWSSISSIHLGSLSEKIEAANQLASLAHDNDRNKKIIVEEGGVPQFLRLLNESGVSPDAQIAAVTALYYLSNDGERVRAIVNDGGVPIIVKVLADSAMKVQTWVACLVARMAENDFIAQDEFAKENAIRPLVTMLSFETFSDGQLIQMGKQSVHSIVEKEMEKNSLIESKNSLHYRPYVSSFPNFHSEGSSRGGNRKERENEKPDVKHNLKNSCAKALWMLARGSVSNSKRITETKGLLCLAKLVEKEDGELQYHCLMTMKEITAAAEFDAELRRTAFKTNSSAAKAVVDQLIRVIKELDNSTLQIAAIKSIGSLARSFPASENRVISPLVALLSNRNQEVTAEAAIALGKFASPENYLHETHSKAIVEFNGLLPLLRLLRGNERTQLNGLILLCYLALHVSNNEALEPARVLTALEGVDRTLLAQSPDLKELVSKAIYHINLYHTGPPSQRLYVPFTPIQ